MLIGVAALPGDEDEPIDSHLLVLDVVSVEFILGSHVRGNQTGNTEVIA